MQFRSAKCRDVDVVAEPLDLYPVVPWKLVAGMRDRLPGVIGGVSELADIVVDGIRKWAGSSLS
jgi:uncharacterized protein with HEPN domain